MLVLGAQEGGGREGASRTRGLGRCGRRLPGPLSPGKPGLPGWVPALQGPLQATLLLGAEEGGRRGEEEERQMGGTLLGQGIRGSTAGVSPTHLALGSLLGFQVWSPDSRDSLQPRGC